MTYDNRNGVLAFRREIVPILTEKDYLELKESIAQIEQFLADPMLDVFATKMLELKREQLQQEAIEVRNEVSSRLYKIGF